MSIKKGLVSVTFRQFSPEKIIALAKENGLSCIEWGSDIHVPCGDLETAKSVRRLMDENGLETISYGTYYKLGENANPDVIAGEYIKTALALGAPNIRIWAGTKGSEEYTESERALLTKEAETVCDRAKENGLMVSFEYHQGTLTDTPESACKLMEKINRDNVFLYWQPNQFKTEEYNINALEMVKKYVSNIHIFHWSASERFALDEGVAVWKRYLEIIRPQGGLLMEFVKNDDEEQFVRDARTLTKITEGKEN